MTLNLQVRMAAGLVSATLFSQAHAAVSDQDLTELSLEALMNVEVTSVSKREQPLSETAAAVYVITREEIRRSGMTTIPELLRLVPGIHVARIDANKWAISSRGFLNRFANKMLVLIDGRSVYTPLFAGVYWDTQDTVIEDIARIEVIRGPGATLWGANAVNGVINIVTLDSAETHGGLITAVGGTHEAQALLRYGGGSEELDWRAFGRFVDHSAFVAPSGTDAGDEYDVSRAGFRLDWNPAGRDSLTVQGDVYDGDAGESTVVPILGPPYSAAVTTEMGIDGHNVLARWSREFSETSSLSLQGYYDSTSRSETRGSEERDTYDLDFHRRQDSGRHHLIWGLGVRRTSDRITNSVITNFSPTERTDTVYSAFIQDDLDFEGGDVRLTFGSKFENNDYTGFELQPNMRLFGKLGKNHAVWGALSHAIRSPARAFDDAVAFVTAFPDPLSGTTTVVGIEGNPDVESEELRAHEFGYRFFGSDRVSVDLAAYYNLYNDVISMETGAPRLETTPVPFIFIPQTFGNLIDATSFGVELSSHWRPTDHCKLFLGYTYLDLDLEADPASNDVTTPLDSGNNPQHQIQVRSNIDLPKDWTLDVAVYHVDELPNLGIEDYTRTDLRAAWSPDERLEVSVSLQNLFDDEHAEYVDFLVQPVLVERSAVARVTWRF